MLRPMRRAHVWIWSVLTVVLPALIVWALRARGL